MNKIVVTKELYPYFKDSKGLVMLMRRFELPIQPFVGLTLVKDLWCVELKHITYDATKMEWVCSTEPDRGLVEYSGGEKESYVVDKVVSEYIAKGWQKP